MTSRGGGCLASLSTSDQYPLVPAPAGASNYLAYINRPEVDFVGGFFGASCDGSSNAG